MRNSLRGRILPFADGRHLLVLAADAISLLPVSHAYEVDLSNRTSVDLGEIPGNPSDIAWAEIGKTVYVSRTVNGLTNIWKFGLQDKAMTQITSGIGPDFSPMPDPAGKGIYFVNGKYLRDIDGVRCAFQAIHRTRVRKRNAAGYLL